VAVILILNHMDCGFCSGRMWRHVVWIFSNERVFVGASDHHRKEISVCIYNEPSLELTWRAPKISSCADLPLGSRSSEDSPR
jgi:hypothetical protein